MDDERHHKKIQELLSKFGNMTALDSSQRIDFSAQMNLSSKQTIPECYSTTHNSFLAKIGFVNSFNSHQETMKQDNKQKGSLTSTLLHTTRPAIEHGIAPTFSKDLIPVTIQQVAKKVNHIHVNRVMFVSVIHAPYRVNL